MKILKSLNRIFLLLVFVLFFNASSFSNEPVDIWNLDNNTKDNTDLDVQNLEQDEIILNETISKKKKGGDILNFENLENPKTTLVGLYDPQENNLTIDMWKYSDSDQVKNLIKKIEQINLSDDAIEILNVALLTNAYPPKNLDKNQEFTNFKINYLIKREDLNLIKNFLLKNESINNNKAIKFYLDYYLKNGNLDESCKLISELKFNFTNDYIDKFKIYCLIKLNKNEEAQIYFDLKKEQGFKDKFFESKFNYLMGYSDKSIAEISEKSVLNFHLSHVTSENFNYTANEKTPKFIWKYLSSNNLLEDIKEIDLENAKKIMTLEKATHEKNYSEKELLQLYKRFDFSLSQLLDANNLYNKLPNFQARAILYQRLLLSDDPINKVNLAMKMKSLFRKDKIENAFVIELSNILKDINFDDISSSQTTFYEKNIINEKKIQNTYNINNKIIHQSKLLDYFAKGYSIDKANKETNDILKKVKANKKYIFSNKDKIMLDSLIYDGVDIQKKYANLYERNPNIPTDLQVYINNEDVGMILLRLVEIIGEDNLEDLGTETLYFITTTLNEINLDKLRNNILIKTLPLKV